MKLNAQQQNIELTVLMPCLDEEQTLRVCIEKAKRFFENNQVIGEVIVADNGSTDQSCVIAIEAGARLIHVEEKGYGAALRAGIAAAEGKYIVMGDADDSYDFSNLMPFLEKLREGYDLVMGNRFAGGIEKGAMPLLHKYLGNPVLSFIGRLFFGANVRDFHCGLRGFKKTSIDKLNLVTSGMEFASEMVVKASLKKLAIVEVPTTLNVDGRSREPHLRSWRDGWRHLRFLLLLSPRWLFLYPSFLMLLLGLSISVAVYIQKPVFGAGLGVHSLLFGMAFVVIGVTFGGLSMASRLVGERIGLFSGKKKAETLLASFGLEKAIIFGAGLIIVGVISSVSLSKDWFLGGFSPQKPEELMLYVIPSVMVIIVGINITLFSFLYSVIDLLVVKSGEDKNKI